MLGVAAGLWTALPAQAQFPAYDFAATGCAPERGLLRAGFEPQDSVSPTGGPSGGGGGPFPGAQARTVLLGGQLRTYLLYLPTAYTPQQAWPLVVALHGAAGSAAAAASAAVQLREQWITIAEREGAIVLVPIASGAQGGWVPSVDQPTLACAIDQTASEYNLDLDRRYLWGFSAGAHFAHALALGNPGRFAAYAINAGALEALACAASGSFACGSLLPQMPRRVPVSLRVGVLDPLQRHVATDLQRLRAAGWDEPGRVSRLELDGGHHYGPSDLDAAWAWFAPRRLPR